MAVLVALLIIISLLGADECRADDLPELPDVTMPCAPEVTEGRRDVVAHEGRPGIWYFREVIRCMLGRLAALPRYAERVDSLEERLQRTDHVIELDERRIAMAEEGEQEAVGALEAAQRRTREAEEDRDAWHRSRILWFVLGSFAMAGLVGFAAWVLDKAREAPP